jgi:predicted phosphodiesterase
VKVAVISDIHSNRQALESVLEDVAASDAAELWCLGDLVGYGADPNPCVQLMRRHAAVCLAGNHDLGVVGRLALDEFSPGASLAAQWTTEVLEPENRAYLATLQPTGREGPLGPASAGDALGLYHGSPRDPVWEYVLSTLLAELCLDEQAERVSLIGHSHVASAFVRLEGQPTSGQPYREGAELDVSCGEWMINPGSVGQPRDGDPRAAWLLLDLERQHVCFRRTPYDVAGAAAAIRAARLPASLAERLQYGQ